MLEKELLIQVKNPKAALKALKPDIDRTERFEVELVAEEKGIRIKAKATDEAALRAAIGSYSRLIEMIASTEVKL
ncbi:MAG: KEOPS complex subunit Pcc1 [archaeon]